jgi:hypothetical protein
MAARAQRGVLVRFRGEVQEVLPGPYPDTTERYADVIVFWVRVRGGQGIRRNPVQ